VTYSGKSAVTPGKGQVQTTTFEGKSDHLKFDFTGQSRTITLDGNVTLHSIGTAATGDISADTVVVTLDANLKPTKVDITGSPAKTTIHQEPGK
jgi:lipopolysaccharide export system protein LptA